MDKEIKRKNMNLLIQIAIRISVVSLAWLVVVIILNTIKYPLVNLIYRFDTNIYYLINDYSWVIYGIVILTLPILVVYYVYRLLIKILNPIYNIDKYIDAILTDNNNEVRLPSDLKNIEDKLNKIKYENLKNEQIAKEAEQRKNDLVVYLAHDLKTPLTSVIGYLTLLSETKDLPIEYMNKYIDISLKKAERLEDLINEFFEITRFNLQNINLSKEKINLSHMINQITEEFYPILNSKNITCNIKSDVTENIYIYGDSDKLARVFDNILRNAINYSYENTEIEINLSMLNEKININFKNKGDMIPEGKLEKIFEKFYRLDSSRTSSTGGSGLGLAISKEIIELHDGKITANSNEEYTEFIIELPIK